MPSKKISRINLETAMNERLNAHRAGKLKMAKRALRKYIKDCKKYGYVDADGAIDERDEYYLWLKKEIKNAS